MRVREGRANSLFGADVPDRCKEVDSADSVAEESRRLWGCNVSIKNVCPLVKTQRSEWICAALNRWTDMLGRDRRANLDEVIAIVGQDTGPRPHQ